jgi:hypothetical protein
MPIVAMAGVTAASLYHAHGRAAESAELLGAAARLRGAEDATHPEVAALTAALRRELGDAGLAEAFGRGRALGREGALARLDPAGFDLDDVPEAGAVRVQTRRR